MRPNIFDIATKELHQDAFITWLLKFADNKYADSDSDLNNCAKKFVEQLIQKQFQNFNESIIKVEAGRQWDNIDVWAEINDKYLIIIEDKTVSSYHSGQLGRYKEHAQNWCDNNHYERLICIYLKTGNESLAALSKVEEQGFSVFSRVDFINLLNDFKIIENDIFIDFYQRLERIEKSHQEFENKIISEWNGDDWQGFFQFLEKNIDGVNWSYVNNPNGGFWNAVISWDFWGSYPVYLQLEEGKLCFKISTHPDDVELPDNIERSSLRDDIHELILKEANDKGLEHIRRPYRFGNGNYMTVAIVDRENWLGQDNEVINKESVIKMLLEFKDFIKTVISLEN